MIGENQFPINDQKEQKEAVMKTVERIKSSDEETLKKILRIDDESFPEGWQYEDAEDYYRERINDSECLNIILKKGDEVIGYLLAIPAYRAYEEIHEADPELKNEEGMFYVETISIAPSERGGTGFVRMFKKMFEEAGKEGKNRFSAHTRVSNGLSKVVQKLFKGKITEVRRIEKWKYYDYKEPADYIAMTWDKK